MVESRGVVVTGSRGIAAGVASQLSEAGHRVFLIGGEDADSAKLSQDHPNIVGFSPIDIRNEDQIQSAFHEAKTVLGDVTDVIGIVGGSGRAFGDGPIHLMSKEGFEKTLELNLTSAFLTAREAIKLLLDSGGTLTLTSSVLSQSPSPQYFQTHSYAVSKAGVNGLVTALSAAYLGNNIRVNGVMPGLVATPMAARAATNPEIMKFTEQKQPLVAAQLPVEDVVKAYLYLFNNPSVTGQMLVVDGGWSTVTNI